MEKGKFLAILREMRLVCEDVNKELKEKDKDCKLRYEVLQLSDLAEHWDSVYKIADFYNHNWLGNVDFMHIPDFYQTLENCRQHPIIIAREEGKDEILGISTLKYDENTDEHKDPYFPESDAKYFSITGILTKKNNKHKGLGKKIYEIALRSAHNYEKYYPGTKIMCVIDCRNSQSLKALSSAVENIKNSSLVGKGRELPAHILGYYELRDKKKNELIEAPTLVMEVGLNPTEIKEESEPNHLSYNHKEGEHLFNNLLKSLREKLKKYGINPPVIEEDKDCGMVYFYHLQDKEKCRLENTKIFPNDTEKGNNRVPVDDSRVHSFIGPCQKLTVEGGR